MLLNCGVGEDSCWSGYLCLIGSQELVSDDQGAFDKVTKGLSQLRRCPSVVQGFAPVAFGSTLLLLITNY